MPQDHDVFNESARVIDEIENQLDKILQKKIGQIDENLEVTILKAREEAGRERETVEKDISKEKNALAEYRNMIREAEAERASLIDDVREHFKKILQFQKEIEGLAKATAEEIRAVNEIQSRLEETRQRTAERAAFLKNDLRERFGIVADVPEEKEEPLRMNLELELEKLRKIKELLAMESAAKGLQGIVGPGDGAESPRGTSEPPGGEDLEGFKIPEIGQLIETEGPSGQEQEGPASPAEASAPREDKAPAFSEEEAVAFLESCRRTEPSDGWGEIEYFQRGDKAVIDGERLISTIDKNIEESRRLIEKLGQTESPKDQFFIKQELVNFQEGLRALFLRIVKMSEKGSWSLSRFTRDVLNIQVLRVFLERLSMENWSNAEEFTLFAESVRELESAFRTKVQLREAYLRSLKEEVESF
jgi:uncharacterized membrane-anchored protein YhcB (DUF1043 family)